MIIIFHFLATEIDLVYNFARDVGFRFVLDLNAFLRSGDDWNSSVWNSSNAQDLLNYASSKGYAMDFELGNEPELYQKFFNKTLSGAQIANDYKALRMLLNSISLFKNSKIVGPALSGVGNPKSDALINDFFNNGGRDYINGFTFHHYYMANAFYEQWIDPKVMDTLIPLLQAAKNTSFPSLWLGETGSTWNNDPNDNTFIAGFWLLDKLGLSALYGLDVVIKFVFMHRWFESLISHTYMKPTPDYWLCFFYKKLIGQQIYNATFSPPNPNLRIYAASSKLNDGSYVVYGMTLTNDSYTLDLPNLSNKQVTVYQIREGVPGNLTSPSNMLNGQVLRWNPHQFWPIFQGNLTTLPLELPGFSQFFLVVNQNNLTACPPGWYNEKTNSHKCIKFVNETQPMFAAKFDCTIFGANASILSIDSAFENTEIIQQAQNSGCDSFYHGLIRWTPNSTQWTWIDNDPSTYRNWKSGYPVGNATNFCAISDTKSGTWMDTDCDLAYCYACQLYI